MLDPRTRNLFDMISGTSAPRLPGTAGSSIHRPDVILLNGLGSGNEGIGLAFAMRGGSGIVASEDSPRGLFQRLLQKFADINLPIIDRAESDDKPTPGFRHIRAIRPHLSESF